MENTVKERLKEFIKLKKISVNKFEQACGLSTGYVGNIRVSIQPDKIKSIAHIFPDLNTGWLLTGEGEMLKEQPMVNSFSFAGDGNNNVGNSIQGSGSIHSKTISSSQNESVLLQKIEYLESLLAEKDKQLAEKERLIEILMKNK